MEAVGKLHLLIHLDLVEIESGRVRHPQVPLVQLHEPRLDFEAEELEPNLRTCKTPAQDSRSSSRPSRLTNWQGLARISSTYKLARIED